jgi:hypothetical protein
LGKPLGARQRAVLGAGGVLVPAESALSAGDPPTARVATLRESDDGTAQDVRTRRLAAAVLPGTHRGRGFTYLAELVATPETAKRLGLPVEAAEIRIPPGTTGPDTETEVRVEALALRYGGRAYIERGFVETYNVQFVLLALVGGLI